MTSRDEQMAALSLLMDEKELANLRAQHRQWEIRKALQRGDMGSPVIRTVYDGTDASPLTFAPLGCRTCGMKLTTQSHAGALTCVPCRARYDRLAQNAADAARFEEARLALNKLRASRPSVLKQTLGWCAVAAVLAVGFAWIASKAAWAIGGALP